MLEIRPATLDAFAARAAAHRRQAFVAWCAAHADVLGPVDPRQVAAELDRASPDAAVDGVDTDESLFAYVAARLLMPMMTGAQYLLSMDVVFAPDDDAIRLRALLAIRERSGGQ